MFPLFELESSFQDHVNGELEPESVYELGKLCQQWLLSFVGAEKPEQAATQQINSTKEEDVARRLAFALAASICVSGAQAAQVIQAYGEYINNNGWLLCKWVSDLTERTHPHHPVDILATFDALASTELYETTRYVHSVSINDVRWDACAWDNLKVFEGTLPQDGFELAVFRSLAFFTVDPSTAIHQKFVQTDENEKTLFNYRLERIRTQLMNDYNNGYTSIRHHGEKRATLSGEFLGQHGKPSMVDTIPVHKEAGFDEALHLDPERSIHRFFENLGDRLYIASENWKYVDEITQAFLDSGLSPEMIMAYGPWKTEAGAHYHPLESALSHFSELNQNNQRFYACLYRAYLAQYSVEEIIKSARTPEALVAAYQATSNKAFLQGGNEKARDLAIGQDLGL